MADETNRWAFHLELTEREGLHLVRINLSRDRGRQDAPAPPAPDMGTEREFVEDLGAVLAQHVLPLIDRHLSR